MKRKVISYRTHPDSAQENQRLIENVFRELQARMPDGLRYLSLNLGDGAFMHVVETEDGASSLPDFDAFQAFQRELRQRCAEPPQASDAVVVGNYRMLGE
jgi:hypothetical protein